MFNVVTSLREKLNEHTLLKRGYATSSLTIKFTTLLCLSVALASLGLILDNTPVIVGSMLIAPLLNTILALGLGITLLNKNLAIRATLTILGGSAISILTAVSILLIIPMEVNFTLIAARFPPDITYFLIAIICGIAGGLILTWKQEAYLAAGVSMAIALIPPLAAIGIALSQFNPELALSAGYMYIVNLIGVILGCTMAIILSTSTKSVET